MQPKSTFKILNYFKKRILVFVTVLFAFTKFANSQVLINEGFDNITTLTGAGWFTQNNSQPIGVIGWFQGNNAVFNSHSGAATSYIGTNFQNGAGLATLSNWLLTPNITLKNGDVFTFWTRTVDAPAFPDRLQVRMSTNGSSTNVGATATSTGDFTTLLLDINPTYTTSGFPNTWTQYTITISGVPSPTSGRLAFRYFVENGGPSGANSDYIGIDDVNYTAVTSCSGTPNVGNTLSDAAGNIVCAGQTFTLSLQNNFGGMNHQWQRAAAVGGPYTNIAGATSATYTTSQVVATYYRDSVFCVSSSQFAYSTPLQVNINPACCFWTTSTPVPIPIMDAPAVTVGNFIYTFTAVSNNAVVANSYKFDGTTWTAIAPYPVAAEFPSACTDGVNIYVLGGYTTAPSTLMYRYNVATNTYTQLASFSVGTWNQSCVYLNGKIYKFGGSAAAGSSNALEIYDIATNTWTTGANYPTALSFIASMTLGGYIYTAGGVDGLTGLGSVKTYRYDPATNTWSDGAIADLAAGADRWGASGYLYGPYSNYGSFALAGGYVGGVISNTAIQWDPSSNVWNPLPTMVSPSARFAAAYLNGSYYAIGGRQTNTFVGSTFNQKLTCSFPSCSGTPAPGNTIGPNAICAGQNFILSLQNVPSVTGLTFQWQSSPDNVTYTNIAGATSGTLVRTQAATTWYRCQVTCSGNTGTSTPLKVTDGQGVFTSQPSNVSTQCGSTTSFSFAATGLGLTYSWQYRVNSSSPWLTVNNGGIYSGATTTTLTLTDVPTTMSGYQYRGLMVGPCTAVDYTNIVTLTVNPLVATVNPSSATICSGQIQQLSITNVLGTPPLTTVSYPSGALSLAVPDNTPAGVSHTINVATIPAGAVVQNARVTINMTHTWDGDMVFVLKAPNGQILNLDWYLGGTGGAGATTGFTNTVISSSGTTALSAGTNPYTGTFKADASLNGATGFPPGPNGFLPTTTVWTALYNVPVSQLNGAWTLAMYDGGPGDFGVLTSWTLTFDYTAPTFASGIWSASPAAPNTMFTDPGATIPYTGTPASTIYVKPTVNTNYSVVVSTPTPCVSAPTVVPVSVTNPVTNLTIPATKAVCVGDNTTITATANGGPITWQWQVSNNGGVTFSNISGATSSTLTLTGVTQTMNNYQYKVVATASPCGSVTSATVTTLIVNPLPTVTLAANPTQVKPGVTTFVTASSTPAGASYAWTLNGTPITGATTSSVFADIDRLGSYKVTVTDVNGCVRTSSELVISATDQSRLFIYPNPNNGQFQARLYSNAINLFDAHTIRIYNSAGSVIITKRFPITSQYVRMDFDLRGHAAGVYVARVTHDFSGKTVSARFVIQN